MDSFSIKESAGVSTNNYPIQIGRPFVQGEIPNFPQLGICTDSSCQTVSQWLSTQADVKERWTDGSVKHSVLSFYVPTLSAGSTAYFTIQNQSICNCGTGLNQAQMLGSNFDFDAKQTYSNGVSGTVSARALLTQWDGSTQGVAGPVYYWAKGLNATTLIIADHRNNQQCNGHACSSYDFGSDANKSIRPEFHVTFWPLTNQVKVRFVGEIVNTEAMQNQSYDLTLSVGSASPTTVYSQAAITQSVATRWTAERNNQPGQTWSVTTPGGSATFEKEIWINGVPPPAAINHNLRYLTSTLFLPNYDTSLTIPETNIETYYSTWNGQTGSYIYSTGGWWLPAMGTAGASPHIGPMPSWELPWFYTGDIRMQELALRVGELEGSYTEHMMEGHPGNNINRSDPFGGGTGVGHVLSITNRKTFFSALSLWSYGTSSDDIVPVGTATDQGWTPDAEHEPDFGEALYAVTGDFYWLQELLYSASFYAADDNGAATNQFWGRGPTGAEGGQWDDDPRTLGWYLRTLSNVTFVAPDADFAVEKVYFGTLMNDFIAIEEGARCGSGDLYSWCGSSPFHRNTNWIWGYTYRAQLNNEVGMGIAYPTLHQWAAGNQAFVEASPDGVSDYGIQAVFGSGATTNSASSPSITFASPAQCSQMHVGQVLYLQPDGWNSASAEASIAGLSCPSATLSQALPLSAGGGAWTYAPVVASAVSQFSSDYLMFGLGRAAELGFSTGNLTGWLGQFFIGLINDPGSNPRLSFNGRMPTVDVATGTYITSYSRLKQGFQTEWQSLSSGFAPAGEGNSPPEGYPAYARAAYAMLYSQPGGSSAWTFFVNNVNTDTGDFSTNPKWALLPRSSAPISAPPANKCDMNQDGVINVLDVQIAIAQAMGLVPCTLQSCNASMVLAIVSAALGQACTVQ